MLQRPHITSVSTIVSITEWMKLLYNKVFAVISVISKIVAALQLMQFSWNDFRKDLTTIRGNRKWCNDSKEVKVDAVTSSCRLADLQDSLEETTGARLPYLGLFWKGSGPWVSFHRRQLGCNRFTLKIHWRWTIREHLIYSVLSSVFMVMPCQ